MNLLLENLIIVMLRKNKILFNINDVKNFIFILISLFIILYFVNRNNQENFQVNATK